MSEKQNDGWVKELKELPIFNMSLSSKELFHSNFIGWILETYPVEMGKKFSEVLGLEKIEKIENVLREKNNIDLSFELGDTLVFIENKVKSIAYKEQLDKYSKQKISKGKMAKYILLSLDKPTFITNNIYKTPDGEQWNFISYKDFLEEFLRPLSENIREEYHRYLIEDYIAFMEIIDKNIVSRIKNTDVVKLYKDKTEDNELLKDVWSLRMHDLFQKGVFEKFANAVYDEFKQKDSNAKIHIGSRDKNKDYTGYVLIGHGMTNAVGLLHVTYQYNKDFSFGVQIQGNQYRKFIEGPKAEVILKEANRLKGEIFIFEEGFDEKIIPSKDNKQLRELSNKKALNEESLSFDFNKYYTKSNNSLFLYKYIRLDQTELSYGELIRMIVNDMTEMIKRISK